MFIAISIVIMVVVVSYTFLVIDFLTHKYGL